MLTAAKKNQNNRLGAAASSQKKNKVKKLLTTPNVNTATKLQPFPDDEVAVIISPQQKKVSLLLQNWMLWSLDMNLCPWKDFKQKTSVDIWQQFTPSFHY